MSPFPEFKLHVNVIQFVALTSIRLFKKEKKVKKENLEPFFRFLAAFREYGGAL